MGYSHHWFYDDSDAAWQSGFTDLVADAERLVAASKVKLGTDIDDDGIVVGVAGPAACEELWLMRHTPNPFVPPALTLNGEIVLDTPERPFAFVKTNRAPYDEVVVAILLRAAVRLRNAIELHSDGTWDDWAAGRQLVEDVFGPEGVPARPEHISSGGE